MANEKHYIVRHTESEHHIKNLGGGWYDTPLTEKGKAQARRIAVNLFQEINRTGIPIYSSDLKRAAGAAEIIAAMFQSDVIFDGNLREMNFGECGGKPKEWRDKNIIFPSEDCNRLEHRLFKGAESRREVGTRAQLFMERLLKKPDDTAIIVTHGFMANFLILAWMKVPVEHMGYADFRGNSGGVTLLNEEDTWRSRNVIYTNNMEFMNK